MSEVWQSEESLLISLLEIITTWTDTTQIKQHPSTQIWEICTLEYIKMGKLEEQGRGKRKEWRLVLKISAANTAQSSPQDTGEGDLEWLFAPFETHGSPAWGIGIFQAAEPS